MISLKHVSKSFGPLKAVDDASLEVKKGEIICLIGRPGSGKSTLLRCIAGLEDPEEGEVWIDGERLDLHSKDQKKLEKLRIKMGFVFQHFNLFPHMTVLENLTLAPIQVLGMDKAAAEQRAWNCWPVWVWLTSGTAYPSQAVGRSEAACCPLPAVFAWTRRSCSLMSPPRLWTRRWSARYWTL